MFTLIDLINLIGAIVSIILGVGAIILSIIFFFRSTAADKNSSITLIKIQEKTDTLASISGKLLQKLTTYITTPRPEEESIAYLIRSLALNGLRDTNEDNTNPTKDILQQWRVDNLIAAAYYCALGNLIAQSKLPPLVIDIETTEDNKVLAKVIDQSKADFDILISWIQNSDQKWSDNTANRSMREAVRGWIGEVKSLDEIYEEREHVEVNP